MKKLIFTVLLAGLCLIVSAKNTQFGIYVDKSTYRECKTELEAYRNRLSEEGLDAKIIADDWDTPEKVKGSILTLAAEKKRPLEGVVFVGEIPIVMVRGAQWMTTAFKMNEEKYPIFESSVASDRFYDDFDLNFDFIKKDEEKEGIFYYRLNGKGSTQLHPDIYSARMKVPEVMIQNGADKYELMRRYLRKVVAAHRENNPLDRIAFFFGSGYNTEDLNVWRQKCQTYKEYFPQAYTKASGNRFLTFFANDETKWNLFNELQRPGTDVFQFTEHGNYDTQYINGETGGRNLEENLAIHKRSQMGGDETNYTKHDNTVITQKELIGIRSNPKVLIFNACYNGSFHNPNGYIAGVHIFGAGDAIVAQGNTVNVLQDKEEDLLIGYLSLGQRIGLWQKEVAYLESHLIGDPTYRFTVSEKDKRISEKLTNDLTFHSSERHVWEKYLKSPLAAMRCAGIVHLAYCTGSNSVSDKALSLLESDLSVTVRSSALHVLRQIADEHSEKAIMTAMKDQSEVVVRHAVLFAGEYGSAGKDSCIIKALYNLRNTHPELLRIRWLASNSIKVIKGNKLLDSDVDRIKDSTLSSNERIMALRSFRNNRYGPAINPAIEIISDPGSDNALKKAAIETLGWYNRSVYRKAIIEEIRTVSETTNALMPYSVSDELAKTIKRLENR